MKWLMRLAVVPVVCSMCVPAAWADEAADEVVVKMGAVEIKASEAKRLLQAQPAEARAEAVRSLGAMENFVRREAMRKAVLAEVNSKGWEQRPEAQLELARAREQALVSSYVNHVARPAADYPAERDLKEAYESNKASFTLPRQYHLAQLYLAAAPDGEASALERKAADLAAKAQDKNADFAALARANSQHEKSAAQGGDMGWMAENQMVAEIRAALAAMANGQVSKPIRSAQGWHVVKLLELKEQTVLPLEQVRDGLVDALRLKKAQENEGKYLQGLAAKAPPVVNQIALGKLKD